MSERVVGDGSSDDAVGGEAVGEDVGAHRLEIIDAASGGRFHHAMSDQRSRAHAFERLLRWQRMRHELMEPAMHQENRATHQGNPALHQENLVGTDLSIDLRPVTASAERLARRRSLS